jgi:uncharacterized protein
VIELSQIHKLSQQIAQAFHPEHIILFGSYAYGHPTEDSDVDLLVILPFEISSVRKALQIIHTVQPRFPVDLLARTPAQVQQRLAWNDFFMKEIIDKGKVIYAVVLCQSIRNLVRLSLGLIA